MARDAPKSNQELSDIEARAIELFGDSDGFELRGGHLYPRRASISKSGGKKSD